jgi:hypothetical protein
MNGPEHYREAERLADMALDGSVLLTPDTRARLGLAAQVHATLALAAATALPLEGVDIDGKAFVRSAAETAWMDVAGVESWTPSDTEAVVSGD